MALGLESCSAANPSAAGKAQGSVPAADGVGCGLRHHQDFQMGQGWGCAEAELHVGHSEIGGGTSTELE